MLADVKIHNLSGFENNNEDDKEKIATSSFPMGPIYSERQGETYHTRMIPAYFTRSEESPSTTTLTTQCASPSLIKT